VFRSDTLRELARGGRGQRRPDACQRSKFLAFFVKTSAYHTGSVAQTSGPQMNSFVIGTRNLCR
jgi:hypothetical protein